MYEQLKLDNQLCFRFYAVSRLLTKAYYPFLNELGLTYPQYLVLMVLWENDRMPVNDIAKRLYLNTNTLTPLLKRMESNGIVKRTEDKDDKRVVTVSLTEKGKELETKAADIPYKIGGPIACGMPDKIEDLALALDELMEMLK